MLLQQTWARMVHGFSEFVSQRKWGRSVPPMEFTYSFGIEHVCFPPCHDFSLFRHVGI